MRDWIILVGQHFVANWQSLLLGGLIIVGVVMFLIGVLKCLLLNKIKNKLVRKVILSFMGIIIVLPLTWLFMLYKGIDLSCFWAVYTVNAVSTILIYWFYENTGLRNLLELVGKNTVVKVVSAIVKSDKDLDSIKESTKNAAKEAEKEAKDLLLKEEKDLKNL